MKSLSSVFMMHQPPTYDGGPHRSPNSVMTKAAAAPTQIAMATTRRVVGDTSRGWGSDLGSTTKANTPAAMPRTTKVAAAITPQGCAIGALSTTSAMPITTKVNAVLIHPQNGASLARENLGSASALPRKIIREGPDPLTGSPS